MHDIQQILSKHELTRKDIIILLGADERGRNLLYSHSAKIKREYVDDKVYFRGLVELSNICRKNCLYCGIRNDNDNLIRYNLTDQEILDAARFAYESRYGSVVLQSGEMSSIAFTDRIDNLLKEMRRMSNGELGVTLSLGEQSEETYRRWYDSGAHRYLLRIESSNRDLYHKIHPQNAVHDFDTRMECLRTLKKLGYQVGTGVMVGLPFQTLENLADDILFMKELDVDMIGLGPYIEHPDTPLYEYRNTLLPLEERLNLSFKMIAILRIVMKDINIAASTALQAIDKIGREKAIKLGANIIMPNITPGNYRDQYRLYEGKPCTDENPADCANCLEARIAITDHTIGFGERGDSKHFKRRNSSHR